MLLGVLRNSSPSSFLLVFLLSSLLQAPALLSAAEKAQNADGHPIVAGFERFYSAANADAVKGGRLLLGELNCLSCHKPQSSPGLLLSHKQAPILDNVGSRVRRSYLRKFLRDPQAIKPGTTMPNLFAGLLGAERRQED